MRLKECALAIEGDISKVLQLSKLLDAIALKRPDLEDLCLAVAKFCNAIAHEHHARQGRELLELVLTTATDMETTAQLDSQLAALRVTEAQMCAAKLRARSELENFG